MAFSLYYTAKRKTSITTEEKIAINRIIERYCSKYPFKRKTEDFCVYDLNEEESVIFSGSTKLPNSGYKFLYEVANYWLKCLTEITKLLSTSEWEVLFDDVNMILDEKEGWRFPTDEEYAQQKGS